MLAYLAEKRADEESCSIESMSTVNGNQVIRMCEDEGLNNTNKLIGLLFSWSFSESSACQFLKDNTTTLNFLPVVESIRECQVDPQLYLWI